ncbi:MAG: family 20 glycosylhydrolase [Clostridia bacterium]|nr:family 20 glycosylhydrolase [Clostridia bacterium]
MYIIPEVKSYTPCDKFVIDGCNFTFIENIDERVKILAKKVTVGDTNVEVKVEENGSDAYKLTLSKEKIVLTAQSQAAAYYGIQTIRQIIKNGYCDACEIDDAPDFKNRGIYFDITRGRIPTLETLKELVDNIAYAKANMLQLYVEHVFEFKEYDGIYQRTGYITAEEIKELDRYCKENFIDFVPSLSCFGHLYELLSTEKYKHLCELIDYKDTSHYWHERMPHHTINPSDPESIEIIKSLIDQYAPLFSSKYFNICCDETFDLGRGRNEGKDKARLYVDFVKKIIAHVKTHGKIAMMWGDIIDQHSDLIGEIDEDTVFLNWNYSAEPYTKMIYNCANKGKTQFVCPGITNWSGLIEFTQVSVPNISKMAKCGYECGAEGLLTTCWGDHGHLSPYYACLHGLVFGAEKGWNVNSNNDEFGKKLDLHYFGYEGATDLYNKIARSHLDRYWYHLLAHYCADNYKDTCMKTGFKPSPDDLTECFNLCESTIPYLMASKWENEKARKALLCVANGVELMIAMTMSYVCGEKFGVNLEDAENWLKEFKEEYLSESKMGELVETIRVFYALAQKFLA